MNKYQKAWGNVENMTGFGVRCKQDEKDIETIRELVNKETPMKPKTNVFNHYFCPRCDRNLVVYTHLKNTHFNRCNSPECGQRIDWSDNK